MKHHPTRQGMIAVACGLCMIGATGCGGNTDAGPDPAAAGAGVPAPGEQMNPDTFWTEQQVMELAGVEADPEGLQYRLVKHPECTAAVLMTTRGTVELYADAGDLVATNPAGDVGADVSPDCFDRWVDALSNVTR